MLARLRVAVLFRARHGRWPRLARPRSFTEQVQWRKLNDRDEALAALTDKLVGKQRAAERLGSAAVIPTYWSGTMLPELPPGRLPLIVKANHGCNQSIVVRDAADWQRARRIAPRWLARTYGAWLDEWHYCRARQMLLVEPFVGPGVALPLDYKIYVFHGRAEIVQLHLDRGTPRHRWSQFDRQWRRVSAPMPGPMPAAPATLAEMLAAAETLAAGFDHLRVDFYEVEGRMLFGEFCLFPGSGLDPFDPVALDDRLGRLWGVAAGQGSAAAVRGPALET